MTDNRKFLRHFCEIKTKFDYYQGNPEEMDLSTAKPKKGKGCIHDISLGGLFIISNERLSIENIADVHFKTKKGKYNVRGTVVRTGLLANNPSEVVQRLTGCKTSGDSYFAVEFYEPLAELPIDE